jgi:hypothetical protein
VTEEIKPKARRGQVAEQDRPRAIEPDPIEPVGYAPGTKEPAPLDGVTLAQVEELFRDDMVLKEEVGPPVAAADNRSLREKLTSVMDSIDVIEKTGYNERQKYSYQKAVDVARAVRRLFIREGVVLLTDITDLKTTILPRDQGMPSVLAEVKGSFTVTDGLEIYTFGGVGVGIDVGDKGVYKAITGMLKYGLRTLLLIPDERDDPEVPRFDEGTDGPLPAIGPASVAGVMQGGRQQVATSAQLDAIKRKAQELDLGVLALAEIVGGTLNKAPDIDETLPVRQQQEVLLRFLSELTFAECGQVVQVLMAAERPIVAAEQPVDPSGGDG